MQSFAPYLDLSIRAARAAGDLLRADFHRATGPRGDGDKAPADTEAEQLIQSILLGETKDFGFLGEETGRVLGTNGSPIWVIDPNDGTRDYIKGRRGSSVSIALVWRRRPVLGVVHPFGYPDGAGAMYAAADGREGVWKDGIPIQAALPSRLTSSDVVLVSGGGDRAARANLQCTTPARVMSIPSIAHRLARVAAGEASATTSLYSPKSWDFAAGHCLILAAGGVLLDQHGNAPVYEEDASGTSARLFAGSSPVARQLSSRNWDLAFRSERETAMPITRLRKGGAIADSGLLSRAQGAWFGYLAGSALGFLFEDDAPGSARSVTSLANIETAATRRRLLAGQLGASGEMAVAAARSLIAGATESTNPGSVYRRWAESRSGAVDRTMQEGVDGRPSTTSPSASALIRVTPLTLWAHTADPMVLSGLVREDTALTHASPAAQDAASVLAITLRALIRGETPAMALAEAHAFARRSGLSRDVIDIVVDPSKLARAYRGGEASLDALNVLGAALHQLSVARSYEDGIEAAVAASPNNDFLPALVGALMGAHLGLRGIPQRLRGLVASSRPMEGLVPHPRPSVYWATDALAMAEALLTAR